MKLTILTLIATTGVLIPVVWVMGMVTSVIYFFLHGEGGRERRNES